MIQIKSKATDPHIAALIDDARAKYDAVKMAPEHMPDGYIKLIELRNVVPDLLLELERLASDKK